MELLDQKGLFSEFFLKKHISKYLDRIVKERLKSSEIKTGLERALFTTQIKDIASKEVHTIKEEVSIQEAASLMAERRIGSLIVVDDNGVPVGIITDRDLREKVVASGRPISRPVREIMNAPLITVEADRYAFEAITTMIKNRIHHLPVVQDGRLCGMLTNHDLLLLQGISPLAIAQEIQNQETIEGLSKVSQKVIPFIGLLIKEEVPVRNILRIITEINDSIICRVIDIAQNQLGPAPVPFCWLVYGSEGRREQTFTTDQDNGLVYLDPSSSEEAKECARYFKEFSEFVVEALVRCGFARCRGNYMASNPQWCQPLKTWKDYFRKWINTPTPEAILRSVILFDFRGLYGDLSLAEKLRSFLLKEVQKKDIFLLHMAKLTVQFKPPLGFFRTFVVEKSGEHKNELNLKYRCLAPIVNIVRLAALEVPIGETSTLDRLERLKDIHSLMKDYAEELAEAFQFLMSLRIHHQYEQILKGKQPDNYINPNHLSNLEKKFFKEVCSLISHIQDLIEHKYFLGRLM
ncbi:DUF294 nucleotidyltransferase-like domain-containing protein [Thermosulfurimonas dismutans]|uniref:DUF294 nucleotidyltransferase-like domain-containing protein n=1 Tax=Thermosulfurimonas dismutans TaxID=999894 RepID=UPI00137AB878|nr:DUF294 nucleotidyltransferase-like domain-containing protein [Thermosulfurimonas dismutans]